MNNHTKLSFHSEAREKMICGVKQLADAVKVTLGPKGMNVAIVRKGHRPHLTKDGVTVANAINLPDPFENLGCQIVKEAAQRTADVAGDGTTTSTVLAASLLLSGHKLLEAGHDPKQVVAAFQQACHDVTEQLASSRVTLTDHEQLVSIATISANGEEQLGRIIAEAIDRVGPDGPITVENAKGFDTKLDFVGGTVLDQGFVSPYFATNQAKGQAELEKVLVLCYNNTLSSAHAILPALELAANSNRSMLIIANDYSTEALQALVMNKMKGTIRLCAIKAPEFGNARTIALQDIAAVCDGNVFGVDGSNDREVFDDATIGYADRAVVDKNGAILIGTRGSKQIVQERVSSVQEQLGAAGLSEMESGVLYRRKRRLAEGIAIVRVGGVTEVDMLERRDRVDDALCASRAARSKGIQPGGGVAMARAAKHVLASRKPGKCRTFEAAYESFTSCCNEPFKQVVANAGEYPDAILQKLLKRNDPHWGYNVSTSEMGNMLKMKVVDPHAVVESCLKHATSVACNVLMIGCAIAMGDEQNDDFGLMESI
jgi:chaperonin GroEL